MYPVSEAFLTTLHSKARQERLRGTVGSVAFKDKNILSLSYSNRCSDTKDVTFGSAYIGQIEVTFCDINIPRGAWKNKKITLEWGLVTDEEEGIVEYIPVGVFYVTEAQWSITGVTVKASDVMAFLDAPVSFSQSSGTIYGYLTMVANELGLELGVTEAETRLMPNGTAVLGVYPGAAMSTYRDLVSYIAQVVGGFAYATRDGKLAIRSFSSVSVVDEITNYEREYGSLFSDFSTEYAGISITDMERGSLEYYDGIGGEGSVYISLSNNPLLQYGVEATKTALRSAVANVAAGIVYTPFQSSLLSSIAYDLGDLITCSGGVAGQTDLTCCIMSLDWNSKHLLSLRGYGADPSLSSGQSKADRAVSALAKNQKNDGISYYTYINTSAISLQTTSIKLLKIAFATADTTSVDLWFECKWNVTTNGSPVSIAYEYYLDGIKLNYEPIDRFETSGYDTRPHPFYLMDVTGNRVHYFEVRAKISAGSAVVNIGDLHAELRGQKLVGQARFDGIIEIEDVYTPWRRTRRLASYVDMPTVSILSIVPNLSVGDTYTGWTRSRQLAEYTDNASTEYES